MAQQRVYIPGHPMFRIPKTKTKLLAFFTWVDNDTGLEYSNWRLVEGKNGLFVSSPCEQYDHPEKGPQFYNYVKAAYDKTAENNRNAKGDELIAQVLVAAKAMYAQVSGNSPSETSTGRGPVEPDDDDGLPF